MTIGLGHYLTVAAILFTIGIFGIFLNRKNVIVILMSIELILLAVNINLVAFSAFLGDLVGPGLCAAGAHCRGGGGRHRTCHPGRLLPQSRLDRGRGHQSDEGLRAACTHAIVFLPLLGAIIAGLIAAAGARCALSGRNSPSSDADHGHRRPRHAHSRAARRAGWRRWQRRPCGDGALSRLPRARARPSWSPRCCCLHPCCCRGSRSSRLASAITTATWRCFPG